uniref:Uncharacterized protein n=1 Tax=Trichogramma kaykai TaxID=54128 RepID=A0ABD2XF14_9HYME
MTGSSGRLTADDYAVEEQQQQSPSSMAQSSAKSLHSFPAKSLYPCQIILIVLLIINRDVGTRFSSLCIYTISVTEQWRTRLMALERIDTAVKERFRRRAAGYGIVAVRQYDQHFAFSKYQERFSKQVRQKVTDTSLLIQSLEKEAMYTFMVQAETIDLGPPISGNVTTGPQDGSPMPPSELSIIRTLSSVELQWTNGATGKAPLLGYYIETKSKEEAQKTLEESMAMDIEDRHESDLELYRSRQGAIASISNGTLGKRSTLSRKPMHPPPPAVYGKSPPRPSPASVAYHSDEESLKGYDENPDDSSVTEKPSEISSTDSQQQSESENESVQSDPHSFVNHYANVNDSLRQSWKRQKPVRNYSSYTDSEPEGSAVVSLNGGQIIMNNMARSRAPLPGFSSFV